MQLFILLCVLVGAFAANECPSNSHYNACGTACPLTCENYKNPPKACVLMCNPGCHCDEGYVKNKDGQCVLPEDCEAPAEAICEDNEEFKECGTACPLTCDNYDNPPKACVRMCVRGCHCKEGYVKSKDGRCVLPEQCPSRQPEEEVCVENSKYQSCGTACPLTCDNYDNPPKVCVAMCVPGCHCEKGYVKTSDGRCVLPEQCPSRQPVEESCGENQVYQSCGTACPLTCDNYNNPPKVCVAMCVAGCHCKEGYVKTSDGRCVLPEQCQSNAPKKVCRVNEQYYQCGTACKRTCDNYNDPPKPCAMKCVEGCDCVQGLVRNQEGLCVSPKQCPQKPPVCGYNEVYYQCGTACKKTCDNYDQPPKPCAMMCVAGCDCRQGYVRNSNGECVLPQNCPKKFEINSCLEKPDGGVCRGMFPMYYYDARTGSCNEFIYGGCQGNGNRFPSAEECLEQCADIRIHEAESNVCELPLEIGPCMALFHRYGFNKKTGQCEKFVYGGCGGNANNFRSIEDCQSACPETQALDRPDCDKAPETGFCKARVSRFYYDQEAGMCKKFIYGGCGGNRNNFESEFDCYNKCGALHVPSACQHEKSVGHCRGAFQRYFYNKATGQCEEFIYGGCGGNSNNFNTIEDCKDVCNV